MSLPVRNPTKSYWIEAAKSPLRDFRSSQALPRETDVVIVGSGYAGATLAYWLHKYTQNVATKPKVLMLEARDICGSATARNGGQLRPHAYSRYAVWKKRFGADSAMALIRHEMAHLPAFKELAAEEGIANEICLKFGETFDAAMTPEAWKRLKGAYEEMRRDHGAENDVVKVCRLIEDPKAAEEFTQMKGCIGAVVHPSGQVWSYKFIHAILRILLEAGNLNLQAHTPAEKVSERDANGWVTVTTPRGTVKARTVIHATNRWTPYLLPEFSNLIQGTRAAVGALKAPEGFLKNTGAQHYDSVINNYHLQLPPPYNTIILGGARAALVHQYDECYGSGKDKEDKQFEVIPEFMESWPKRDVVGWPSSSSESGLSLPANEGGVWAGVDSSSIDGFPYVGAVPKRSGHFVASGFSGHGMPRILLSTAALAPLVLDELNMNYITPALVESHPRLVKEFVPTEARVQALQKSAGALFYESKKAIAEATQKPYAKLWAPKPRARL